MSDEPVLSSLPIRKRLELMQKELRSNKEFLEQLISYKEETL